MKYNPGAGGGTGTTGEIITHQLGVQGAKGAGTLGFILGEKGLGAVIELEFLGDGAKALFKARQQEILARNLTGPTLYLEIEKAKLAAFEYEEGHLNKRIEYQSVPGQGSPDALAAAKAKLPALQLKLKESRAKITAASSGAPSSTPTAAPSAPTTAKSIGAAPPTTTALPAQGQFAARMNPEVEKERTMRDASTKALGAKAKSQVQALIGGVGESQSQSAAVATGAQAAASGVVSAGASQGVQPVDAPNANDAQENVSAGQDILQQVLAVAEAAPGAVDEAMTPTPAAPS
jgi:hypothetical protein